MRACPGWVCCTPVVGPVNAASAAAVQLLLESGCRHVTSPLPLIHTLPTIYVHRDEQGSGDAPTEVWDLASAMHTVGNTSWPRCSQAVTVSDPTRI